MTPSNEAVYKALELRYPGEWPDDSVFDTETLGVTFRETVIKEMHAELAAAYAIDAPQAGRRAALGGRGGDGRIQLKKDKDGAL